MTKHPHVPHPRDLIHKQPGLLTAPGPRSGTRLLVKVNDWAALRLAAFYGAAVTIWLFALYSVLGAVFTKEQVTLLFWSNAAQLVFCPLMVYVGNLLGKGQQAKADADHQAQTHIAATVDEIKTMLAPPYRPDPGLIGYREQGQKEAGQ